MAEKILLVDDEANILEGFRRTLGKRFSIETALGPARALDLVRAHGPYAVVVSDLRMPKMDGIELLAQLREISRDTVRVMLTAYADLDAAIAAVNEGQIFRFLTKPCSTDTLVKTIEAALEQHRLITAERDLLYHTLRGSIQVLSEILALANPEAFGRSRRIQRLIRLLMQTTEPAGAWPIDLAAALSQIGCVSIPRETSDKMLRGKKLTPEEQQALATVPALGAGYISRIPRLEEVAEIIRRQDDRFDAQPKPPFGARMLKIVSDYDLLVFRGMKKFDALAALKARLGCYDLDLLKLLEQEVYRESGFTRQAVPVYEIKEGMVVDEDVFTKSGLLLLGKGQGITATVVMHLENFARSYGNRSCGVNSPVPVLIPTSEEDSSS